MAKAKIGPDGLPWHYIVTIRGTYYVKIGDARAKKPYEIKLKVPFEEEVLLPEWVEDPVTKTKTHRDVKVVKNIDEIGILAYLMATKRLHAAIRKKPEYSDFEYLREKEIVDCQPSDPNMPLPRNVECLNLKQLKALIKGMGFKIEVKLFSELKDLRNAVLNYMEAPDSYNEFERRWRKRHAVFAAFSNSFDELNEDADDGSDTSEI